MRVPILNNGMQLPLPFVHTPEYAGWAWVTHAGTEAAEAWLDHFSGRLALWGEAGTGKTHLLHRWMDREGARLGVPSGWPHAPVAVDHADQVAEGALLHLLNAADEAGYPVLLAARNPPGRWGTALPDLRSRLRACPAVALTRGDEHFLGLLLARLLAERQLVVRPALQRWMLTRLPRDAGALREAAARLDVAALASGHAVTQALISGALSDLLHDSFAPNEAAPSPEPPCLL